MVNCDSENVEKFQCDDEESKKSTGIYEREKWANKLEFVLSGIGYAVGLGNIWRFPYLCYKNGGGAFLIPYFLCILTGALPIFLLEVGLGQRTSEGAITAWNVCPIFKGVGFASTMINFMLNIYYIVILAWGLHYLYNSLGVNLPWNSCENSWNTNNCFTSSTNVTRSRLSNDSYVDSVVEYWESAVIYVPPVVEFILLLTSILYKYKEKLATTTIRKVLGISSGIHEPGGMQWELVLSLFIVWILVYFVVWKGIKTSGKIIYFTALFPYFILLSLFIRGITLDGAWDGIQFYLKPDFSKVTEPQVWIDAGTQIFYSYATALGCMIALGSYNKINNNFIRDCAIIAVANSGTSLYAGCVIFSVLGFMAKERNVPVAEVVDTGPGLIFLAYPKAVTQMAWSWFWSSAFFFMILLIGLASQFVAVEGFITAIVDVFPRFFRGKKNRKEIFIAFICLFSYVVGLSMVTKGGMYVFQIFDFYAASGIVMLFICFCESICIAYFYGVENFYDDIQRMVGFRLIPWFKYCWLYVTPAVTLGILLFSLPTSLSLTYNRNYKYPVWALCIGWTMAGVPILTIPTYFIWYLYTRPQRDLTQKWQAAIKSKIRNTWIDRGERRNES